MNSLSQSQLKTLIELEAKGEITAKDIYRRAALAKVQKEDGYVSRTLAYVGIGGFMLFFAGTAVIPFVAGMWILDVAKTFKGRSHAIREISAGNIIDYLEGDDLKAYERDVAESLAIDVEAVAVEPKADSPSPTATPATTAAPAAPTDTTPSPAKPSLKVVDLPAAMGRYLHPTIISAKPRVGKGRVVQAAWRAAKKAHPGLTVYVIDPKPHPSEAGYWKGVDRYWGRMIEDFPINDETLATELTEFIHEWRAQGDRPTLLIVDELVKLEAILPGWYKSFLIPTLKVEASSGETDQRFLWAIAQSPQVKDLGLTGGSRAVFDFLTLQRADSIDHAERVKASISAIKTIPSVDEFESIPSGVAFWHSRVYRWGGVPVLEVPHVEVARLTDAEVQTEYDAISKGMEESNKPISLSKPSAKLEAEPDSELTEKPDLTDKEIYRIAMDLERWIGEHPEVDRKKWWANWNAHRKGFSRPQFAYLLALIEE